jgi:2-amino-4-hydroxy-6-hydroxymethyldihydropteridine diphosphokinase
MATVYLALGSNVGIGDKQFDSAIALLGGQLSDIKQAPRYTSKAVGFTDQPDFLNSAVQADTKLSPQELLTFTQTVEQKVGRIRRFRWGPREIDIDIIFYDDLVIEKPTLTVPHSRLSERDFVLKPLCDLNPQFVDPITKNTIQELYDNLPEIERSIKD